MDHKDTIKLIKALKEAGAKSATISPDGALVVEFYPPAPLYPFAVSPWYPRHGPLYTNVIGTPKETVPFQPDVSWFTCGGQPTIPVTGDLVAELTADSGAPWT